MTQHDTDTDADMTHPDDAMTPPLARVTVEEAAKLLGVSVDAVRKRIERGTLQSEKRDGTRFVFVNPEVRTQHDGDMTVSPDPDMTSLVASMQDQIDTLKQELDDWKEEARRKDAILLTLAQRVPELEHAPNASPEPRERPQTAWGSEGSGTDHPAGTEAREKPSWWRRWLLGTE